MKMLRTARKEKGLTMRELGEKVGVSESAISQYETGKREADFETLLKIGEILDCSIDYLLRGGDEKKPDTANDAGLAEIMQIFTSLDSENRSKLLELAHLYASAQHKNEEK